VTAVQSVLGDTADPQVGLRRAQGATRTHVAVQFLFEGFLVSAPGGAAGTPAGALATVERSRRRGWAAPPAGGSALTGVL
jgi:putative ABC transport system permease protein